MRRTVAVVAVAAALGVTGGTAVAVSQRSPSSAVVAESPGATPSVPTGGPGVGDHRHRAPRHDRLHDVLAALVAKGTITQAQADAITKAMADAHDAHDAEAGRGGMGRVFGYLRNTERAVAEAIGITPKQLRDELRQGSTIAEVAKSHGVAESKVVDAIVAQATTLIDQAVSDGHLTTAQATKLESGIRDLATKVVEGEWFGFGGGLPGFGTGPGHGGRAMPGHDDGPPHTAPAVPPSSEPPALPAPTTAPSTTAAATSTTVG